MARVAVARLESTQQSKVDVSGELFTLFAIVVGFYTSLPGAGVGIEVNANKDGITVAIGDGSAAC